MLNDLTGRRILVTGASSGIGEAIARSIVDRGGAVALLARRAERLAELAAELAGVPVAADVSDAQSVERAVTTAATELGGLDGVCNSAGVLSYGDISQTPVDEWRHMFDVNVFGLLAVTRAAIPHLKAAGRSDVVNISSMAGRRLLRSSAAMYGASKAAVNVVSEGLRLELASSGVRVTVIAPGMVDTDLFNTGDERGEERRQQARERGLGADEVAATAVHVLAAPERVVHLDLGMVSIHQ